jgi:Concanavalin A-like lectin/glucanases superfamily
MGTMCSAGRRYENEARVLPSPAMAARLAPWIALAAAAAPAGCFPEPDYRGTSYRCGTDGSCPADFDCIAGRCVARGGAIVLADDALDGEFGAGRFEGTTWAGEALVLSDGAAQGVFVSRVLDAGAPVRWKTIGWGPAAPYGKPLPDRAGIERDYAAGGVDMTGNVVLLHFDEGTPIASGIPVPDASGRANNATTISDGSLRIGAGMLGGGIEVTHDNHLTLPTGAGSDLEFGTSDFTWSLWIRTVQNCAGNKSFIGEDQQASAGGTHIWLGCAAAGTDVCSGTPGAVGGRAAGYFTSEQGANEDGGGYCGTSRINDDQWHHVVVVKSGHAALEITVYVDGEPESERVHALRSPLTLPSGRPLTIGTFPDGGFEVFGAMDEIAIWRRALSGVEVRALYRRAALDLTLQVRACLGPACADNPPFVGPTGPGDAHGDHAPTTGPPVPRGLVLPEARYAQYRVELTGRAGETPALRSVTLTADRP